MAFCGNCGTQMADNAGFCPNCGKATAPAGSGAAATPQSAPATNYNAAAASAPLAENVAGMLAYFTIIPAIIFLVIEPYKRNRFVRFHSFQSLFFVAGVVIVDIALRIVSSILNLVPMMGWMITTIMWSLWGLAVLALWLLLVIKAYQHQIFKLPFIGDLAEKQAGA